MKVGLALCLLGLVLGCAPPVAGVRMKAASILSCVDGDVRVQWVRDLDYEAAGCSREVSLRCPSQDSGANCRAISPITTARASAPATATASAGAHEAATATVPVPSSYSSSPPGGIYAPGQYNQRTGAVQTDYGHQFTRP